jgi:hypothetical protein
LLETHFAVTEKDRLYRCLDRVLKHKQDLFIWLKQKWADLFHADFGVLLYDLTSTYFECFPREGHTGRDDNATNRRPRPGPAKSKSLPHVEKLHAREPGNLAGIQGPTRLLDRD